MQLLFMASNNPTLILNIIANANDNAMINDDDNLIMVIIMVLVMI